MDRQDGQDGEDHNRCDLQVRQGIAASLAFCVLQLLVVGQPAYSLPTSPPSQVTRYELQDSVTSLNEIVLVSEKIMAAYVAKTPDPSDPRLLRLQHELGRVKSLRDALVALLGDSKADRFSADTFPRSRMEMLEDVIVRMKELILEDNEAWFPKGVPE